MSATLRIAQLAAVATLFRSIALDRWITVVASLVLLGGVLAARRGRTWGVALSLAAAVVFPLMWLFGLAPPWFVFVGMAGSLPFLSAAPALARFDKQATALLALLAGGVGVSAAFAWKEYAMDLFRALPMFRPSLYPHHGFALLVLGAWMMLRAQRRRAAHETPAVRVGAGEDERVRIAALDEADAAAHGGDEWETPARRQARR